MKRDIKFRAILKGEHSSRDVWGINFARKEVMVLIAGYYEWIEWKELVQFTGLTDKNGKEIYEGDIIRLNDIVCPITWDDGGFQMITSDNQGKSAAIQDRVKKFEIIGNIYENPELLNNNHE